MKPLRPGARDPCGATRARRLLGRGGAEISQWLAAPHDWRASEEVRRFLHTREVDRDQRGVRHHGTQPSETTVSFDGRSPSGARHAALPRLFGVHSFRRAGRCCREASASRLSATRAWTRTALPTCSATRQPFRRRASDDRRSVVPDLQRRRSTRRLSPTTRATSSIATRARSSSCTLDSGLSTGRYCSHAVDLDVASSPASPAGRSAARAFGLCLHACRARVQRGEPARRSG